MANMAHRLGNTYKDWITDEGLTLINAWARDGLSNEQIASNMGVAQSTLYEWQKKHLEISEALKTGKAISDIEVENALFKRATGFSFYEVTQEAVLDKKGKPQFDHDGNQLLVTTKRVKKYQAPDTGAAAFWLKNRKPETWQEKQSVAVSGNINNPLEGLTTEELRELISNE